MFGRRKATQGKEFEQLEQRIKAIESALVEIANATSGRRPEPERQPQSQPQPEPQSQTQKTNYAGDQDVQAALKRIELEEQTIAEVRSALQAKLKELEEKSLRLEWEQQASREAFQREIEQEREAFQREMQLERWALQRETEEKRAQLDRELRQRREEEMGALQGRVDRVWKNYNFYLSQIQSQTQRLTETVLYAGRAVVDNKDVDIDALFQEQLSGPRPAEEQTAEGMTPPEEQAVPAAEEMAPSAGEMVWAAEEAVPAAAEATPPEGEQAAPAAEDMTLPAEEAAPAAESMAPPVGEMVWAAAEVTPPEDEEAVPAEEDMAPPDVDVPFIMREGVPAK